MNFSAEEMTSGSWSMYLRSQRTVMIVITSIILAVGVFGNALVLIIYTTGKKRRGISQYFIPPLAGIDLASCVISSSFELMNDTMQAVFSSDTLCKTMAALRMGIGEASPLMLLVIAVQRYLLICKPHNVMDRFWKRFSLILTLFVSSLFGIPLVFFARKIEIHSVYEGRNVTGEFCSLKDDDLPIFRQIYTSCVGIVNIVLILIIVILYLIVGKVIYRKLNGRKSGGSVSFHTKRSVQSNISEQDTSSAEARNTNSLSRKRHLKLKGRFTLMFLVIFIFYLISYLPVFVLYMAIPMEKGYEQSLSAINLNAYLMVSRMYIINNIVNPFIYGYFDVHFRRKVVQLLCLCRNKS